jgi:hypothetical protein
MSQLKSETTLKPIEDVLESLSFSNKTESISNNRLTAPSFSIPTSETITSSLSFKIIIILIILLAGIIGYTYLEKEVNQFIEKIKNYFETKKYTKEEEEKEKEKKIEKEKTSKEQTTEDIIKDIQSDIEKNKNKKKEQPINHTSSSKLNSSPVEQHEEVEEYQRDSLQKALNDATQSGGEVVPDASENHIQSGKKGWCFIGSDNLSRTCAEIGVNDVCMSGEIYPTKNVCINPSLRA